MRAPLVAAITLHPTGGGISVVSRLIWQAVREHWGDQASLVEMFTHENRQATLGEKLRFSASMLWAESLRQTDWILFSHLGLAQVQHALPAGIRRPYGVFLHGIEAWQPLGPREKQALRGAALRLANSRHTAARVAAVHPDIGPIEACPLALLPGNTGAEREAATLPFSLGPRAILVVGRMLRSEQYKGHDQLIDAWPTVSSSVPDAQLIMVGEGDDVPRLKERAKTQPGSDRIVFTGFVGADTLRALYERAAVFALPSRAEGFGLVYLEAMSHGLPCLGSVHDAASEVIVNGETGLLVDQDDTNGMAAALRGLLIDPVRRRAMGESGRARVAAEYSFERFSRRLRELMDAAHTSSGRP